MSGISGGKGPLVRSVGWAPRPSWWAVLNNTLPVRHRGRPGSLSHSLAACSVSKSGGGAEAGSHCGTCKQLLWKSNKCVMMSLMNHQNCCWGLALIFPNPFIPQFHISISLTTNITFFYRQISLKVRFTPTNPLPGFLGSAIGCLSGSVNVYWLVYHSTL